MSTPNPCGRQGLAARPAARIVQALEEVDGKPFLRDAWERPKAAAAFRA
jgi:coproporphyrinogen III oxidase